MKKCLGLFLATLFTLGMNSCSEDFDVAAPYKDITVVYGLLNYGDTAQYIRVQKAFLDQNRSALELAKIADSSFYRNIEVHLKAMKNNLVVTDDILARVDMNNEGFPKAPGVFFNTPNYAFKYTRRLDTAAVYRLMIINKETGNVDSADTRVLDTMRDNGRFYVSELNRQVYSIGFSANNVNSPFKLNLAPVPYGGYYEGYIRFNYVDDNNGVKKDTSFTWRFATATDNSLPFSVSTTEFYSVFRTYIPTAIAGQSRYLDSADVFVWAADDNYYNYLVNSSYTGGITSDQIRPNFTTIRGKDVLGLFGSRAQRIRYNIPVDDKSLDSLMGNRFTKDLNFRGRSDH